MLTGVGTSRINKQQEESVEQKPLPTLDAGWDEETHQETQVDGTKLILGAALGVTITIAIVLLGVYIKHTPIQR